ncbi:MAG: photosynthetic complex putative assembly protein PuhB [Myxococcota bacterium]
MTYGHSHGEHEPYPGLPEALPEGEEVLWQGSPSWRALAVRVFRVRLLAIYFAVLAIARVVFGSSGALPGVTLMVLFFGACLGVLTVMAVLHRRATIYTITNRRIVMRIGVALSTTWNLPFRRLASADLALHGEKDGDLLLTLAPPNKIGFFHFWPHTKPGKVLQAQPALRGLAKPKEVARVLRDAVGEWSKTEAALVETDALPEPEAAGEARPVQPELAVARSS